MLLTCYNFFYLLTCVNNVLLDAIKMSYVLLHTVPQCVFQLRDAQAFRVSHIFHSTGFLNLLFS